MFIGFSNKKTIAKWIKPAVCIPLLITVVFAFLAVKNPPAIDESIETLLVDYRFRIRNFFSGQVLQENILIVAIDEKSLSQYGRWPWNREIQAELIEKIFEGGPKVVIVDILYPEHASAGSDRELADVFRKYNEDLVVAVGFEVEEGKAFNMELEDVLYDHAIPRIENIKHLRSVEAYRVLLPFEPVADHAVLGHVYFLPDRDGRLRWESLYVKFGSEYFPSLALQGARAAMDIPIDRVSIVSGEGVYLDDLFIPTDEFGRLHVNYIGREGSFTYKSAADVLSNRISGDTFSDKIVFVGTAALSTYDQIITPFSANMPGVEKNATVLANIIAGNFMKKLPVIFDLLIVVLTGLAVIFAGRCHRAFKSFAFIASLFVLTVIINQILFSWYGIRMNLVYPLLTIFTEGVFIMSYRYIVEEKNARKVRRMFSSYVTEKVVNELIENPGMARLGGERREITVLFSDIKGFTSYSEQQMPEVVLDTLNEYLTAMTDIIFRWEGTLDKFFGDAIVAFWGAPLEQKNHAELCVKCAMDMTKKVEELQQKWQSEKKVPLTMGIGINTGEVIVGNIGAEGKKMDYTVIGDHVNTGSRVEALTRKYNASILITEATLDKMNGLLDSNEFKGVAIKEKGKVNVRGKENMLRIFEVSFSVRDL